ncbi:non-ribosomal peptide synthetase [Xenorhabdus innexi]|uniref:Peptide synthetase PaxA n=1 Tax=Xenorhabdus innexi TaxID=290109 RepID=A0A1N6MX55_9GAMM|nr:non-ribosomal peptide synthetase [Xenorhabdus innexi]PHM33531.1 pyoverdine sidechain peptide synthetase III, L-Thr-L-Ser component [Xenorhabdus innexi]SIP73364.1 Peptide synthetase PaxA [Xenorhabdus innexi]
MNHPETLKPFALSEAQSSRWFQYQMNPAQRGQNNSAFCARVKGLTAEKLEDALNHLIKRHPMLRAGFGQYGGKLGYQIAESATVTIKKHDARDLDEETLQQRVRNDCWYPFDLENPLRVHVTWYQYHDQECVMVLTFDHIVVDGWSYWILLEELGMLLTGQELPPAPEYSYQDYVIWQQQWLSSEKAKKPQQFWLNNLNGHLTELQLPVSNKSGINKSSFTTDKITITHKLPDILATKLNALAAKYHHSLFAILLATYQILLHRYTGQNDILIGSIMPGRGRALWGKVVGEFVNPVALRSQIHGEMTAQQQILQTAKTIRQAIEHQKYPFSKVLEQMKLQRNADTHPVFQTIMTFQQPRYVSNLSSLWMDLTGTTTVNWGGAELRSFPYPYYAEMPVPLMVNFIEVDQQINCGFHYDTKLFDTEFIRQMMDNFFTLLAAIADNDQQVIDHLPLMNERQIQQILYDFNATDIAYPQNVLLHQLIEQQVNHTPAATALVCGESRLTYDELNRRANQLAHALIAAGVQADNRIGVCMERSPEMVITLLGILKSGAAYVPLDPEYPADRLQHIVTDSEPVFILSHHGLQTHLPTTAIPLWIWENADFQATMAEQPEDNLSSAELGLTSRHLAYVLYTSGSTGLPKGVMNEHRGVVNRLLWAKDEYQLNPHDLVLQKTPFSFDVSVWEFFLPLLSGAQLVMARPGGHKDPLYLLEEIESRGITTLHFVPSMLQSFIHLTPAGRCPSLRQVLCSGEALPYSLQQQCLSHFPHCELHNLYGPTEAAIDVTFWHCGSDRYTDLVPIGHPIANTQMYILDQYGQPVPVGVTGEIHIGGIGVARGYLNRPELTAERFVQNPFSTRPDARMYKTGDLGRWLPDGSIEYLGRNDFQVKIRGNRIELEEIETRLAQCHGVQQVVVIAREYDAADTRLVAYLIAESGVTLKIPELRAQLSSHLPDYMIPSAFVMLDAFPLTLSGKLDRRALPAPDYSSVSSQEYAAPQGENEERLAEIWQTILKIDRVGRHDNFFELGGHSLLVLQLQSRINEVFEVDLSIQQLFAHPSISQLEECIINAQLMQFDAQSLQGLYESME